MFLSLNWLKEFVEIPKSVTPEELARRLTSHTVEVEKTERQADRFKNVVAGKILEIKPHPNADRLRLVLADIGTEKLEIVCGAPNIRPGQFAPVALVGALLPNGLEIKAAEIRGVKSNGMLCAPDELGLGEDHAGIMILEKAEAGQPFSDYLKLDDVIFEVDNKSITHRADLWSHYGMARDISAFLNVKFKAIKTPLSSNVRGGKAVKVKVEDYKLCPRYMALGMSGVKIQESPRWLKDRLAAAGARPINNVVDATNYVMLELGQPLHAFDEKLIGEIVVRRAKAGEIIETLDGVKRRLEPDMLVIADGHKPAAVAGVMGGARSEINGKTVSIIIEAANFDFASVRKTSQRLGLRTEASMRFEKGLDPNLCELGLYRAVELIKKICPGAAAAGKPADIKKYKLNQGPIELDVDWLNQYIGHEFTVRQVKRILEKLGFVLKGAGRLLSVTIPSWRAVRDVSRAEDLAEEAARIYGYDNIAAVMPRAEMKPPPANPEKNLERKIKNSLSLGAGLTETYNYSFLSLERLVKLNFNISEVVRLANPLSQDLAVLRPSLLPGLLENIKTNQAREEEISLYEIGSIFLNRPGRDGLLFQEKRLGLALAGAEEDDLFRKLKGVIEYLLDKLNLEARFEADAAIYAGAQKIGRVREADGGAAAAYGIKKKAALAEISLPLLFKLARSRPARQYQEAPKYPPAVRDLAFVVSEKILYNNIVKKIKNFSHLIKQAELFDVYQGDKLGAGKKSLAFHVIYQADKTLTSEEVDEVQEKLVKHLEKEIGAKIRDF